MKVLNSLETQTTYIREIIIADNDPNQSAQWSTSHPISYRTKLKYISNKKGGVSRARNIGINKSSSDIAAFLDDDCIPNKDWAINIHKFFSHRKNKKIILLGKNENGIPESTIASVEFYLTELMFKSDRYEKNGSILSLGLDTKNFALYCTQIKQDSLQFDNRYHKFTYYEDMDLGIQARQKGYKIIYQDNVVVQHMGRTTLINFIKRERMKVKAYTIFAKKWQMKQEKIDHLYTMIMNTNRFNKQDHLAKILKKQILSNKDLFFKLKFHSLLLFSSNLYRLGLHFEKN